MRRDVYAALGGHVERIRTIDDVLSRERHLVLDWSNGNPWPLAAMEGIR
jgi:hypothetical protein